MLIKHGVLLADPGPLRAVMCKLAREIVDDPSMLKIHVDVAMVFYAFREAILRGVIEPKNPDLIAVYRTLMSCLNKQLLAGALLKGIDNCLGSLVMAIRRGTLDGSDMKVQQAFRTLAAELSGEFKEARDKNVAKCMGALAFAVDGGLLDPREVEWPTRNLLAHANERFEAKRCDNVLDLLRAALEGGVAQSDRRGCARPL